MNNNKNRALEVERDTISCIASVEAMTARQVAMLNYGTASRSAIACTQHSLRRLRDKGLVARVELVRRGGPTTRPGQRHATIFFWK